MIYGSMRVHTGTYGPIFVSRGEKSQVNKVKINISDRDFFQGLVQGDFASIPAVEMLEQILRCPNVGFSGRLRGAAPLPREWCQRRHGVLRDPLERHSAHNGQRAPIRPA